MKIEENVQLKNLNTFRIGGNARYFCTIESVSDLQEAVAFALEKKIPLFVLGEGSNVLITDDGFAGLVIQVRIKGISWTEKEDYVLAEVAAGENWDNFVGEAVKRGLFGIENLSGIPGTVGATPVQNIGAYGGEISNVIVEVKVCDSLTGETASLINSECEFSYRDSIFKRPEGKHWVISSVVYRLVKNGQLKTDYKDIAAYFSSLGVVNPTLSDVRDVVLDIRRTKLPDVAKVGTAGSYFKNPIIKKDVYDELSKKFVGLPNFPVNESHVKIPIAWIIDNVLHLKGFRQGDAAVHENQPLVLVNLGNSNSYEVLRLADLIKLKVKDATGIDLEEEVQIVGDR
ncbi:UDP-N-acetylmuramate dehydrogenase [Candidatus Parcubacteria bacterium]|nr:UDP-N-acetylmuramate dehydrogenase [Candidatus Parcubacteria bacterium]